MQDDIFIHILFTVSETKQGDGIVIIIKRKIHLSQGKDRAGRHIGTKIKILTKKTKCYIQMKSTANAQHVPTTQHNTTLLLQHKTLSDRRSDTHKPFSLNNHTFFFLLSSALILQNRKSRQCRFSLVKANCRRQPIVHHCSCRWQTESKKSNL